MSGYEMVITRMVLVVMVIVGSLNWGVVALTQNRDLFAIVHLPKSVSLFLYALVAVSGILLALDVATWLPFLGESAFPRFLLKPSTPKGADKSITLNDLPPRSLIVYWGSNENGYETQSPSAAYGDYENSGVAQADYTGKAVLAFKCPSQYTVGMNRVLEKHIHYRIVNPKSNGILGAVKTRSLTC